MPDDQFAALISRALDELPQHYVRGLDNVAITYADEPTGQQRTQMQLRAYQTLYGLYEGIPLPARGAGYNQSGAARPHHYLQATHTSRCA